SPEINLWNSRLASASSGNQRTESSCCHFWVSIFNRPSTAFWITQLLFSLLCWMNSR
ncbi:unnamed protein product, partial [Musa acuminata var. zebrina]